MDEVFVALLVDIVLSPGCGVTVDALSPLVDDRARLAGEGTPVEVPPNRPTITTARSSQAIDPTAAATEVSTATSARETMIENWSTLKYHPSSTGAARRGAIDRRRVNSSAT